MPIYEYRCPDCGNEFDKLQKISDPTPACPSCQSENVAKKVSRTSFQLKGGGWYSDGYGSSGGSSSSASASSGGSSSSSSSSSSSEGSSSASSSGSSDSGSSSSSSTSNDAA